MRSKFYSIKFKDRMGLKLESDSILFLKNYEKIFES